MGSIGIKHSSKIITFTVFTATLIVVSLSLVSVFFPALIARSLSTHSSTMEPYELGPWAFPILVVNLILLSIFILHRGKMLPQIIIQSVRVICNFEVSRKITFFMILILLSIYAGLSTSQVLAPTKDWPDYISTYQGAEQFNSTAAIKGLTEGGAIVHYSLIATSLKILGNIRIIPFIESISLLVLTYFITKEITQKRFAGI
ncbi:MAG TPA: hypothetical protein VFW99_04140, partial [Candidatus Nitrosotalea sp.]|nr:hypothetical protein [Candidatus Nitrosotalea sp.]